MKILIDIEQCLSHPTGVGRFAREIVSGLACLDKANDYYLFHSDNYNSTDYVWFNSSHDNFEIIKLPWRRKILRLLALLARGKRIVKPFFPSDIDIYFSPSDTMLPIDAKRKIGMIHDLNVLDAPHYNRWREVAIARRSHALLTRLSDPILTVSEFSRQRIISRFSVRPERVGVIHGGVRPSLMLESPGESDGTAELRAKYGIDRPYFLWCGTMWKRKNVTGLVKAFSEFSQRTEEGALLVLVGTRDNESHAVDRLILGLGLQPHVRRLGYVSDAELAVLLGHAVALVLPSLYEDFGLPALESMVCGTPVIASNWTALPEVVGEAGLLVNPLDTSSIAHAMKRLATDPKLREELSRRGRNRAAQFTWKKSTEALLTVFNEA